MIFVLAEVVKNTNNVAENSMLQGLADRSEIQNVHVFSNSWTKYYKIGDSEGGFF